MNGHKYLADTNTFIFLMEAHPSLESFLNSSWHFSFITEIELLGKLDISVGELRQVKELLNSCYKVAHSEQINQVAINLKQQTRIKIPDALIAATAIVNHLPILTFDKDFAKISTINPSLDIVLLEV